MTTNDPVGVALAGIGAGSATGAAVMTAGVLTLRLLQAGGTTSAEIGGSLLTATLFGGIVAAVLSGWVATASIDDTWRRGVSAAVAVLGAALLAIGATVADQFLNVAGLGVYCVALIVAAVLTHRLAYRLGHA